MKEGKDAVSMRWENDSYGQPSKGAALRPDDAAGPGVSYLWHNLRHIRTDPEGERAMQDDKLTPWAALIIEPDGTVSVYVHNWIRAGRASTPQELWDLTHEAWSTPEKFWGLFYAALGRRESPVRKGAIPAFLIWRCAGCGAPAEGKKKPCDCQTNVGTREGPNGRREQTWWAAQPAPTPPASPTPIDPKLKNLSVEDLGL